MADSLKILSLFSGIGGFELGAEIVNQRLGYRFFQVVAMCDRNPYCQKVLAKNFPGTPVFGDIRDVTVESLQRIGIHSIDCVTGGFPCQDISVAGKKAGIKEGTRSGLFFELMRIVCLVRPRYILLENVAALLANGMGVVLKELHSGGYDAEWSVVSCSEVGGVHQRKRIFIIASQSPDNYVADTQSPGWTSPWSENLRSPSNAASFSRSPEFADAYDAGLEIRQCSAGGKNTILEFERPNCVSHREPKIKSSFCGENARFSCGLDGNLMSHADLPEWLPKATDTANIPYRRDRLEALGNAIVPQCAAIVWQKLIKTSNYILSKNK